MDVVVVLYVDTSEKLPTGACLLGDALCLGTSRSSLPLCAPPPFRNRITM